MTSSVMLNDDSQHCLHILECVISVSQLTLSGDRGQSGSGRPSLPCPESDRGQLVPGGGAMESHTEGYDAPLGLPCPECSAVLDSEHRLQQHLTVSGLPPGGLKRRLMCLVQTSAVKMM